MSVIHYVCVCEVCSSCCILATIPLNYTYTWYSAVNNSVIACFSVASLLHREKETGDVPCSVNYSAGGRA